MSIGGIPIELVDTAGLREAFDEAESIGIRKTREALAEADIVLVVLDATLPLSEEEAELLAALSSRRAIVVRNKSDLVLNSRARFPEPSELFRQSASHPHESSGLPHRTTQSQEPASQSHDAPAQSAEYGDVIHRPHAPTQQRTALPNELNALFHQPAAPSQDPAAHTHEPTGGLSQPESLPIVLTSALTGEGISILREQILILVRGTSGEEQAGMLTNMRQHQAVSGALDSLAAAATAVTQRVPHEMLLIDLYASLRHLDNLTGETTPDDVLNLIFSTFCIGK